MTAVWNLTRSCAETMPLSSSKKAGLVRVERNERDRKRGKFENTQLRWKPAPGRIPYAGREDGDAE